MQVTMDKSICQNIFMEM